MSIRRRTSPPLAWASWRMGGQRVEVDLAIEPGHDGGNPVVLEELRSPENVQDRSGRDADLTESRISDLTITAAEANP